MTSLRTSNHQGEHYSVTMASLPPTYAYDWYLQYVRRWNLDIKEKPSADQWCCAWNGERQRVVAVSGEVFDLRHNTIKILHLLAEPSRDGVRALDQLLRMYAELVAHGSLACVGGDCIAANFGVQRRVAKAGFTHYSSTYLVGRPQVR
jgi:hypothetical protein